MNLTNQVTLITNTSTPLSASLALALGPLSTHLALHHNASNPAPSALINELLSSHSDITIRLYTGDLSTSAAVELLFDEVLADLGRVDVVVNVNESQRKKAMLGAAGERGGCVDLESRDCAVDHKTWDCAVDLKMAYFCLEAAAKRVRDGGRVVTVVDGSRECGKGCERYERDMVLLEDFTKGLSREVFGRMVSVNVVAARLRDSCVHPQGNTQSNPRSLPQNNQETVNSQANSMSRRKLADVDFASVVRCLVTDGGWINGQTVCVECGCAAR